MTVETLKKSTKIIGIYGAGGFGREVYASFSPLFQEAQRKVVFIDDNPQLENKEVMGIPVISSSQVNSKEHEVVISVGDGQIRKKIVEQLSKDMTYITLIHPSAILMEGINIGEGSIVTAGCILTTNIKIGKHAHLNLHTSIGHDCRIGDYFTTAPGARVSGECIIKDQVYFGTNAIVRQGVHITSNVTIGMGGVVLKEVTESGVYVGSPIRILEK